MKPPVRSRWGIAGIVVGCIILIVILQKTSLLSPVERGATFVFQPVQRFFWHAGDQLKSAFGYFRKNSDLRRENADLRNQLTSLAANNVTLQQKIEAIGSIAEQYDYVTAKDIPSVTGQVIGRSADAFARTILINKGESAGIKAGYPVIAGDGALIGKVVSISGEIAKVQLLTDNHSQINAKVQNDGSSPGVVNGQYSLTLVMDFIPQDQAVSDGQLVLTSGLDDHVPAGLLIGTVTQVTKKEGELFQSATVDPIMDYQSLDIVTVLLPTNV